ncbi:MAG: cysteine desulfurase [Clostridiales bacterium]|nr:cysteine desulfurase [Clostridiales bacterium]
MIFLDNASTTKAYEECLDIAKKYLFEQYYNPSAPYGKAIEVSKDIRSAKLKILRLLGGDGKIIFTASGTESDNLALLGTRKINGSRIIISQAEHPAVYNTAMELKQKGFDVVAVKTNNVGRVSISEFEKVMTKDTNLVSIMHVNNETGAINDIKTLCNVAKGINPNVIFHSDGIQAVGKTKVSLRTLGVDLYSFSGHKFHAPKGIGALYIKKGINLNPIIFGGGQEDNLRSATENVPAIMSLAFALEKTINNLDTNLAYANEFRQMITKSLNDDCVKIISDDNSIPFILSMALKYVRGEVMLHSLEKYGIMIGTGSACSNQKQSKRIPQLMQLSPEYHNGIIRVSFNSFNKKDDIEYFIKQLKLEYNTLIKYVRG